MSDQIDNVAKSAEQEARQHAAASTAAKSREWASLLTLKAPDQPFAAVILLMLALTFGGWYVWRATSPPGLIDIDNTEPAGSKLVVNVNTAEPAELMLLPEIGRVLADLIVEERLANGLFRNASEFGARIKGIGKVKLAKIAPHLEGWTDETKK